jgi:hypothetical protein
MFFLYDQIMVRVADAAAHVDDVSDVHVYYLVRCTPLQADGRLGTPVKIEVRMPRLAVIPNSSKFFVVFAAVVERRPPIG